MSKYTSKKRNAEIYQQKKIILFIENQIATLLHFRS